MHQPIEVLATGDFALKKLLENHPFINLDSFENGENKIEFKRNGWNRQLLQAHPAVEGEYGLIELMDNNPLVCADNASTPGPAATLALIALGPLARAGILIERPNALFSFEGDYDELDLAMKTEGWNEGVTCAGDPLDLGSVLSGTFLALTKADNQQEIDDLFHESYSRSFFVQQNAMEKLNPQNVMQKHHAEYATSLSPEGILRVQVLADADGKCGASQMLHMLNVMACFEEDAGLSK